MDKEELQKKYDNSIIVCSNDTQIDGVFNICDLLDLTCYKSEKYYKVFIGEPPMNCSLFHVEQFVNDFYDEVGATKKTILFKQKMEDAKKKIRHKYNNFCIRKGTDMETVVELIQALDMNVTTSPINNAMLVGEGGKTYPVIYQPRQFIMDMVANMLNVVDPFTNKETMIDIKEGDNVEQMVNEVEFYITSIFTTPLHKIYDIQRGVYSIGFGNKKRVTVDEEDFHVFLKALYYLYKCNEWIKKDDEKNKEQPKEPVFNKGNKIMYTIKDSNSNTYPVRRLSERVYESKEHKTLFITDEEGVVTGIYKEK